MVKDIIGKFRKFREKQKLKAQFRKDKRDIESRKRSELRDLRMTERIKSLEQRSKLEVAKQNRIVEVREAQLRRTNAEAGILKARERKVKARQSIRRRVIGKPFQLTGGPLAQPQQRVAKPMRVKTPVQVTQLPRRSVTGFGGPQVQKGNVGGALLDFGTPQSRPPPPKRKTGPGIGQSFRVL